MHLTAILPFLFILSSYASCNTNKASYSEDATNQSASAPQKNLEKYAKAYFASGCFWCVEAVFESVIGVEEVISGYSGGSARDAKYAAVSAGRTNHAESVEVYYDPEIVDYKTLLIVFFGSQDPTTLNRQGPDSGRQYRSSIFYTTEEEKLQAESYIKELTDKKVFNAPIVTEVVPFEAFYAAEEYHQDFERKNPNQGYVRAISVPRLNRFKAQFPHLLKEEAKMH